MRGKVTGWTYPVGFRAWVARFILANLTMPYERIAAKVSGNENFEKVCVNPATIRNWMQRGSGGFYEDARLTEEEIASMQQSVVDRSSGWGEYNKEAGAGNEYQAYDPSKDDHRARLSGVVRPIKVDVSTLVDA